MSDAPEDDPDAYIDGLANLLDFIAPGTGLHLHGLWSGIRQSVFHQCGLALAATSGAENEYDYHHPTNRR